MFHHRISGCLDIVVFYVKSLASSFAPKHKLFSNKFHLNSGSAEDVRCLVGWKVLLCGPRSHYCCWWQLERNKQMRATCLDGISFLAIYSLSWRGMHQSAVLFLRIVMKIISWLSGFCARKLQRVLSQPPQSLYYLLLKYYTRRMCSCFVVNKTRLSIGPLPYPGDERWGRVAVLLGLAWCQRHVKTTLSSCDCGESRSSAIPDSSW